MKERVESWTAPELAVACLHIPSFEAWARRASRQAYRSPDLLTTSRTALPLIAPAYYRWGCLRSEEGGMS
jgi:hypothetical protein